MRPAAKIFSVMMLIVLSALLSCARKTPVNASPGPEDPSPAFEVYNDYDQWTENEGYESGVLEPQGAEGLFMDYFHTLPGTAGYVSGRIVIGDSRCCQLGIYEERAGRGDFAAFAVWGGHYAGGRRPSIITPQIRSDVEDCFREQIRSRGSCVIFFFATVNDYDRSGGGNEANIAAAVEAAEYFASLEFELNGRTYNPRVIVVGFAGCRAEGSFYGEDPAEFNRNVGTYNDALREAVAASPLLSPDLPRFSTVPEIMNGDCGFINDALHYDDRTLKAICEFIIGSSR